MPPIQSAARRALSPTSSAARVLGARVGVLDQLETTFALLCVGPAPLLIHGGPFPDLPSRPLRLHVLRVRLASPATSHPTRARVWSELARRARAHPHRAAWTVGLAGLAVPELLRIVAALAPGYRGDPEDLAAAALAGLLAELRHPLTDHGLAAHTLRHRLLTAAYRTARALPDATGRPIPTPAKPAPSSAQLSTETERP